MESMVLQDPQCPRAGHAEGKRSGYYRLLLLLPLLILVTPALLEAGVEVPPLSVSGMTMRCSVLSLSVMSKSLQPHGL